MIRAPPPRSPRAAAQTAKLYGPTTASRGAQMNMTKPAGA